MKTIFYGVLFSLALLALGAVGSPVLADDSTSTTFDQILEHYEAVRLQLANDTTDNVSQQGKVILNLLEGLSGDWSPAAAGIGAGSAQEVRRLLPELSQAATALAGATSLEQARDAFYDLSKPLVRWRKAVVGASSSADDHPTVAYCSMARRSWLQPQGEISNPYYGQSMPRCGETVDG